MSEDNRDADLGRHLEDFVEELVKSGRYDTRDDVLREGVKLLQLKEDRQARLDTALARGLAQSEAGLGTPIEEVMARLKAKYAAMAKDDR